MIETVIYEVTSYDEPRYYVEVRAATAKAKKLARNRKGEYTIVNAVRCTGNDATTLAARIANRIYTERVVLCRYEWDLDGRVMVQYLPVWNDRPRLPGLFGVECKEWEVNPLWSRRLERKVEAPWKIVAPRRYTVARVSLRKENSK